VNRKKVLAEKQIRKALRAGGRASSKERVEGWKETEKKERG